MVRDLFLAVTVACLAISAVGTVFTGGNQPSTSLSTVSCQPTTARAGSYQTCLVTLRTSGSVLIGDATDVSQIRLVRCSSGLTETLCNSTFESTGVYRFLWYPTVVGTYVTKVSIDTFTVNPSGVSLSVNNTGVVDVDKSSIGCTVSGTSRSCAVKNADRFDNVINWCNFTYSSSSDNNTSPHVGGCSLAGLS